VRSQAAPLQIHTACRKWTEIEYAESHTDKDQNKQTEHVTAKFQIRIIVSGATIVSGSYTTVSGSELRLIKHN